MAHVGNSFYKHLVVPPLSVLNDRMARDGIKPRLSLISRKTTGGESGFMMRVTCPISQGGPPVSADGCCAWSLKEAKHAAALAFLEKFFNYRNNVQSETAQISLKSTVDVVTIPLKRTKDQSTSTHIDPVIIRSEELEMLEIICLKNKLRRPEVEDVCVEYLSSTQIFTAKCKVSDLHIVGKGSSESKARLRAITRMIQIFTGTVSVPEMLKSPKLSASKTQLLALTLYHNEMISSSDSVQKSQLAVQNGVNSKQKTGAKSPERRKEKLTVPDVAKPRFELMNTREKSRKIRDNNDNSVSNMNQRHLADDSQQKTFVTKPSARLLNNNISNCVNNGAESKSLDKFSQNLTQLQVVSQIGRKLGNLEKELNDEMLIALAYCHLPCRQTVAIHSHEYEVFIHASSPPIIFEGKLKCIDPSIRVACLTKLLMCLKKYIEINNRKVVIK